MSAPAETPAENPAGLPPEGEAAPERKGWFAALLSDRAAAAAILIFVAIAVAALLAPWIAPHDPAESTRTMMQPPVWSERGSAEFLLGTDGQGRDILSRLLWGTRLTLLIGLVAVVLGGGAGALLGLLAAFYPRFDPWVMRGVDVMLSFPAILLGLALVAVLGAGVWPVILALAVATVPDTARIARSVGVGVMKQEFVEAARSIGLPDRSIFTRYLLRNAISSIMIFMSLRFGQVILLGAALSFLGLGAQPPAAELGMMASQGRDFMLFAPHIAVIPSVLIFVIVLTANVAGDALRDVLDPRLRS